jgi:hypothetical protein
MVCRDQGPVGMLKKVLLTTVGLTAAAGVPAALYTGVDYAQAVRASLSAPAAAPGIPDDPAAAAVMPKAAAALSAEPAPPRPEGAPVADLAEVFRFDVTPGWVIQRWPRVSTGLANVQLAGYRVPLVTGTDESDLAGALTYYFNSAQQVQRITFHGTTGDVRKLARLLTERYRFARRMTNDPGLVVYEAVNAQGQQASIARIRPVDVIRAGESRRRYEVELVIERPG